MVNSPKLDFSAIEYFSIISLPTLGFTLRATLQSHAAGALLTLRVTARTIPLAYGNAHAAHAQERGLALCTVQVLSTCWIGEVPLCDAQDLMRTTTGQASPRTTSEPLPGCVGLLCPCDRPYRVWQAVVLDDNCSPSPPAGDS